MKIVPKNNSETVEATSKQLPKPSTIVNAPSVSFTRFLFGRSGVFVPITLQCFLPSLNLDPRQGFKSSTGRTVSLSPLQRAAGAQSGRWDQLSRPQTYGPSAHGEKTRRVPSLQSQLRRAPAAERGRLIRALPPRRLRWPEPHKGAGATPRPGSPPGYLISKRLVDIGRQLSCPPLRLQLHRRLGAAPGPGHGGGSSTR